MNIYNDILINIPFTMENIDGTYGWFILIVFFLNFMVNQY